MELNTEIPSHPPRDASTVMLLRDGVSGIEVFLVKRHSASRVLGGAYVFPGGKLDAADSALHHRHLNLSAQALHSKLGEPKTPADKASALFVAALRETFEEAGVLMSETPPVRDAASGEQDFHTLLEAQDLRLDVQALHPWVRWITPRMPSVTNRRFDTRFFMAAMPAQQTAAHDNVETTASAWLRPRKALELYWNQAIDMAPPQIMSLAHLARHDNVASVLAGMGTRVPPTILPESHDQDGQRIVCYPGDPRHSVATRALPGPTRLVWRNQRFEPEGGLSALWTE